MAIELSDASPSHFPVGNAVPEGNADGSAFRTLQKVVDVTTELFGSVRVKADCDPEYPDDRYTVFCVEVAGAPEEIVRLEEEWSRRVNAIVQGIDSFQLSIRPKV